MKKVSLLFAAILGLGLILALLWSVGGGASAQAAPAAELHVCPSGCTYSSIQAAVDAANPGDTIKVAQGTYTDIHARAGITQVVYISKTVTVRGGYTTSDWNTSDPAAHPTTLDAQGKGRVMVITGEGVNPTIEGLRITGGYAGASLGAQGGGVYTSEAGGVISGCVIYSNTASYYGGGMYLSWSTARLVNNTIEHNTANTGVGSGGGLYLNYGAPVLEGNTIRHNAARTGGGVHLFSSNATIKHNTIASNTAGQGGGVEFVYGSPTLTGNIIKENTGSAGGGVYIWGSDPTLVNNAVVDNLGTYRGAGIYVTTGSPAPAAPRLLHNTVARNRGGQYGDGSAIYITDEGYLHCDVALTNTIIFSHAVGISVTAGNTATLNATLWYANGTDRGGGGSINHQNDYRDNPYLAADGYHLTGHPGALDRGVNAGVTTDIDGDTRPMDSGYDLGADETAKKFFVYLPLVVRKR